MNFFFTRFHLVSAIQLLVRIGERDTKLQREASCQLFQFFSSIMFDVVCNLSAMLCTMQPCALVKDSGRKSALACSVSYFERIFHHPCASAELVEIVYLLVQWRSRLNGITTLARRYKMNEWSTYVCEPWRKNKKYTDECKRENTQLWNAHEA